MNLTYESLRYPQDNMRFIFIDAILNNFPYELESYIRSLTEEMETSSNDFQTITYNKHLTDFEKKEIAINDFKYVDNSKKIENKIIDEYQNKEMEKELNIDRKLNDFIEETPILEWDLIKREPSFIENANEIDPLQKIKNENKNRHLENIRNEIFRNN